MEEMGVTRHAKRIIRIQHSSTSINASYGRKSAVQVDHAIMRVLVLREEQRCMGNFFGLAESSQRDAFDELGFVQICVDVY
jgi:hypothetical protein